MKKSGNFDNLVVISQLSNLKSAEKSVRPKVLGAKPEQAGKKEGGWGEGIFARLLPFPFRLSKGKAEGGFGGNSAFPLLNQNEASPATCPNTWRAEHRRKILFSLGEKEIRRAQNEKSKEYFSAVWRAERAVAGLASLLGVLLKKSSNINQKTPPMNQKTNENEIIWQIPEHEYQPKNISWRWLSLIAAIILFAFAMWQENFLFAIFIIIAFLIMNYSVERFPVIWEIKINEKGIEIKLPNSGEGKKFYPMENIEGFDIHDKISDTETKNLAIKFKTKLSSLLKINIFAKDEEKIRNFLLKFTPEEKIELSAIDSFLN